MTKIEKLLEEHKNSPENIRVIRLYEKYFEKEDAFTIPLSIVIDEEDALSLDEDDIYGLNLISDTEYVLSKHTGKIKGYRYGKNLEENTTFLIPDLYNDIDDSFSPGFYIYTLEKANIKYDIPDIYITPESDTFLVEYEGPYYKCHNPNSQNTLIIPVGQTITVLEQIKTHEKLKSLTY